MESIAFVATRDLLIFYWFIVETLNFGAITISWLIRLWKWNGNAMKQENKQLVIMEKSVDKWERVRREREMATSEDHVTLEVGIVSE
jgi:hypothetical protein